MSRLRRSVNQDDNMPYAYEGHSTVNWSQAFIGGSHIGLNWSELLYYRLNVNAFTNQSNAGLGLGFYQGYNGSDFGIGLAGTTSGSQTLTPLAGLGCRGGTFRPTGSSNQVWAVNDLRWALGSGTLDHDKQMGPAERRGPIVFGLVVELFFRHLGALDASGETSGRRLLTPHPGTTSPRPRGPAASRTSSTITSAPPNGSESTGSATLSNLPTVTPNEASSETSPTPTNAPSAVIRSPTSSSRSP